MASNAEQKEASIAAPIAAADVTGATGVYRYASLGTATQVTLTDPATGKHAFKGNFVRIQSRGVSTDVAFGLGSAVVLLKDQLSAINTGHVSAGWTIPADTYIDVIVPRGATHLAFISSATGGFVELMLSEAFNIG